MPRYFVDTFDGDAVLDEQGQEFESRADIRREVQRTLTMMMRDDDRAEQRALIRAEVRDESGRHVMTATLVWSVEEIKRAALEKG